MPVAEESAAVAGAAGAGMRWIITSAVAWMVLYLSPSSCARYMEPHMYTTQSSRNLQAQQQHWTQKQPGTICQHFSARKAIDSVWMRVRHGRWSAMATVCKRSISIEELSRQSTLRKAGCLERVGPDLVGFWLQTDPCGHASIPPRGIRACHWGCASNSHARRTCGERAFAHYIGKRAHPKPGSRSRTASLTQLVGSFTAALVHMAAWLS